jgi:16S rRNA (cytosine1402-N4)-methyltransferase
MSSANYPHSSVLLNEVEQGFLPSAIKVFFDGTLGAGGQAEKILSTHPEIEFYIGVDQDPTALVIAKERLRPWGPKVIFIHGNFSDLDLILDQLGIDLIDGALVDLGVSSMQFDTAERGFSFSLNGPLDMRMNPESTLTAADIVNTWTEHDLGRVFRDYGEEKKWRTAAYAIVKARQEKQILTTHDLSDLLKPVLRNPKKPGINPLTLVFQGLRICVNRELDVLTDFVPKAIDRLRPDGRLAVISFHSLEDRIVKNAMRLAASDKWETSGIGGMFRDKDPIVSLITRKPMIPSEEETQRNPRSRSAKMRIIEKLG